MNKYDKAFTLLVGLAFVLFCMAVGFLTVWVLCAAFVTMGGM
jgi:hypothetical protein